MVQQLQPKQGLGDILGQSIGQGFSHGMQQRLAQQQQQKQQEQQSSMLNAALSEAQKAYTDPNATPEQREFGMLKALHRFPDISNQLSKTFSEQKALVAKGQAEIAKNEAYQARTTAMAGKAETDLNAKAAQRERDRAETQVLYEQAGEPPQRAAELAKTNTPVSARSYLHGKNQKPTYEPTSQKFKAERTQGYINRVLERGENAEADLRAIEEAESLVKTATGFKVENWLAKKTGEKAFENPETAAYKAAIKRSYVGFGDIVKGKVSNQEFQTLEQMVAQAENSPKAAEGILIGQKMEKQIALKERDIVNQLREQFAQKGEEEPPNFDILVQNQLKPYTSAIVAQTISQMNDILNPTKKSKKKDNQAIFEQLDKEFGF